MIFYYRRSNLTDKNAKDKYEIKSTEIIDEIVNLLYEGEALLLTEDQVAELALPSNYIFEFKKTISLYKLRVPLYDIQSNNIYLINRDNVYNNVHRLDYRFPDKKFIANLEADPYKTEIDEDNLRIMSNYDMDILKSNFDAVFYESFSRSTYATDCKRPSFASGLVHINPYYKLGELYFLAYDWNLTQKGNLSDEEIEFFCKQISKFDISAKTLQEHQIYIFDNKAIGLVKHYSLYGSYYMNRYLRANKCCLANQQVVYKNNIVNPDLENQIKIMIKLIKNAPAFVESHTVYRFISQDDFMAHLKEGDTYKDTSFMSTTRNPFYYKENYAFGYILLKIKLPANIKGVGLCMEAYSNFPFEEEIVLPPTSEFRLDKLIVDPDKKFHNAFNLTVHKKYEFTWVGNDYIDVLGDIKLETPGAYVPPLTVVDFKQIVLEDETLRLTPMSDRLFYLKSTIANVNNQFSTRIGMSSKSKSKSNGKTFVFNIEAYDSTSVYKQFFYYERPDGLMITTSNPVYGNINMILELGPEIHVNYYFKFSVTDQSEILNLDKEEWMEWFSLLAYCTGSRNVYIHSNYVMSYTSVETSKDDSLEKKSKTKLDKTLYTFSENIYQYLKHGRKYYTYFEVDPTFEYGQLDKLEFVPIFDLITVTDHTTLYRIAKASNLTNLKEFYLYIVESYPKFIQALQDKLADLYDYGASPFDNISYKLNPWIFLQQRGIIKNIPSDSNFKYKKNNFKKLIGNKKIQMFQNRLRDYLLNPKK
jgi:hypothetical protein